MHLLPILTLTLFPLLSLADLRLDTDDVPQPCSALCAPIVELSRICEVTDEDAVGGSDNEDLLERQCLCTNASFDVPGRTALCAACIHQNAPDLDDAEDISDIMSACGFQSTTLAQGSTSASSVSVAATKPTASSDLTTTFSATVTGAGVGGSGAVDTAGSRPTDASDKPDGDNAAVVGAPTSAGVMCAAVAFFAAVLFMV